MIIDTIFNTYSFSKYNKRYNMTEIYNYILSNYSVGLGDMPTHFPTLIFSPIS